MPVAHVAEIHRYPVKSMQGERLAASRVERDGLRGDRAWAVRDEKRGSVEGARKLHHLLDCRARYVEPVGDDGALPVPEIELPGGQRLRADDAAAARGVGALEQRDVTLWPRVPAERSEHYRRAPMEEATIDAELRATFARLPDEPLPDLGAFPREIILSSTLPGTYFDAYPVFLLTKNALARLQETRPASRFDARRFRPNLLLDAPGASGFPENDWVGRRIRLGEVELDVAMPCPRCLMTTLPFADLPKDPGVMRALVQANGGNLGVYASVAKGGRVREGDAVELLG